MYFIEEHRAIKQKEGKKKKTTNNNNNNKKEAQYSVWKMLIKFPT